MITQILLPSPDTESRVQILFPEASTAAVHPPCVQILIQWIAEYFRRKPVADPYPMLEWLDFGSTTPLQKAVYHATCRIPRGQTRAYRQIAEEIGRPGASRYIGNTLAKNPFPILIPCHRVIRSNCCLGGFGGGMDLKRDMLDIEKAP